MLVQLSKFMPRLVMKRLAFTELLVYDTGDWRPRSPPVTATFYPLTLI